MDKRTLLVMISVLLTVWLFQKYFLGVRVPELDPETVSLSRDVAFGVTIDAASKTRGEDLAIDIDSVRKEIDAASALGVGLARFDLEKKTLENAQESVKLDQSISYARDKKMKIILAFVGRESDAGGSPFGGKKKWEDFKREYKSDVVAIMNRYEPEYMIILPQCPAVIGAQVDSERTTEEWVNFAKEVGLAAKQVNFSTKIVLEGRVLSADRDIAEMNFAESAMGDNDVTINVFSLKADDPESLENGTEEVLAIKKRNHWDGEIWIGNVRPAPGESAERQKDFFLYSIHLANSNGFSGIVLSRLRDGAGDEGGIINADYSAKPSYTAIKQVLAGKK